MEEVAQLLAFPCKFAPFGCDEKHLLGAKESHEDTCLNKLVPTFRVP